MTDGAPLVHRARFDDLPVRVFHGIAQLRSQVFVVEQDCVFLDLDSRDTEPTTEHLWIGDEGRIDAACRILSEGDGVWSVGRIATRAEARARGLGRRLVTEALDLLAELGATEVRLGAQSQLVPWYRSLGFEPSGPRYVEDGILHTPMALETATTSIGSPTGSEPVT